MRKIIQKAIAFATRKHQGQKYNGGDFFTNHPLLVYKIMRVITPRDFELQAAALLHDTLEDTDTTWDDLLLEFNEDIANLVREVTKEKGSHNTFPDLKTQRGAILKFADRLANISDLGDWGWTPDRKQKYIFGKSKFWEGGK